MYYLRSIVCTALVWSVCFALAFAQETSLRVAYVNLDTIMMESRTIRNVINSVQDDIKGQQESMEEKLTRFKVLSESYEKQKTLLTEEQKNTRLKEIDELKLSIEDQQDKINRMIRRSERRLVEPTLKRVEKAIQAVGKEHEFDMVFRSDSVLYASERCDITGLVITKIDEMEVNRETEPEFSEKQPMEEKPKSTPVEQEIPATPSPTPEGIVY